MKHQCIEIVIYKTDNPAQADARRLTATEQVANMAGFRGWLPLTGSGDSQLRADVVLWQNACLAQAAAKEVGTSAEFSAFRETVSELTAAGHYAAPVGGVALMQAGDGVEMGRFRLRDGVTEATLRAAWSEMISASLSGQNGWRGQRLIRLADGSFIDLAFAASEGCSREICNSWAGNRACEAFLQLIEPVSMEFGTVI